MRSLVASAGLALLSAFSLTSCGPGVSPPDGFRFYPNATKLILFSNEGFWKIGFQTDDSPEQVKEFVLKEVNPEWEVRKPWKESAAADRRAGVEFSDGQQTYKVCKCAKIAQSHCIAAGSLQLSFVFP